MIEIHFKSEGTWKDRMIKELVEDFGLTESAARKKIEELEKQNKEEE